MIKTFSGFCIVLHRCIPSWVHFGSNTYQKSWKWPTSERKLLGLKLNSSSSTLPKFALLVFVPAISRQRKNILLDTDRHKALPGLVIIKRIRNWINRTTQCWPYASSMQRESMVVHKSSVNRIVYSFAAETVSQKDYIYCTKLPGVFIVDYYYLRGNRHAGTILTIPV